jgi:hypothetical protein
MIRPRPRSPRALLATLGAVGLACACGPAKDRAGEPAPAPAPKEEAEPVAAEVEAPPPAEEPAVPKEPPPPKERLTFDDFWEVVGITKGASPDDVIAALGEPEEPVNRELAGKEDLNLRYPGVSVTLRASGGVQFTIRGDVAPWRARFPADDVLSLVDQPCEEAAARLTFMDEVGRYSSCKHYTDEWFLDLTVMCRDAISTVMVVWEPLPPAIKAEPRPPDHCN